MGVGYSYKCPKCDHGINLYFGVGMLFPHTYQENVQAAKSGELGDELKNFFAEHPDGAIDASLVAGVCTKCGEVGNFHDLSMYLPKKNFAPEKNRGRWSVAAPFYDADYVVPWDLASDYELFAKYPHKCPLCGGDMKIFTKETFRAPACPRCRTQMIDDDIIMWD